MFLHARGSVVGRKDAQISDGEEGLSAISFLDLLESPQIVVGALGALALSNISRKDSDDGEATGTVSLLVLGGEFSLQF